MIVLDSRWSFAGSTHVTPAAREALARPGELGRRGVRCLAPLADRVIRACIDREAGTRRGPSDYAPTVVGIADST